MFGKIMIAAVAGAALSVSTCAFAQQAKYGTAAEAKAMLDTVIVAVKADKTKALEMFNKGEGGFKDRDLQPFCSQVSDGKLVATTVPSLLGTDARAMKDKAGKAFGAEIIAVAVEGKVAEVSYSFPRPGEAEPVPKVSYVTRIGDLACGVGYYK